VTVDVGVRRLPSQQPASPPARPPARRGVVRTALVGLGPAVVASVAYIDPGNVATNVAAGAQTGYLLLWVVLGANLVAILVQTLSAKLGRATGSSLARTCRDRLPRPVVRLLWVQAEVVVIATDLAEVVGGALGLHLMFGMPLPQGALLTAVAGFALLGLQSRGGNRFPAVVAVLFGVILVAFVITAISADPEPAAVLGGLVPQVAGPGSVTLAAGIVGATVMPHVIYLHSAMAASRPNRLPTARRRETRSIAVALATAGLVNASMLVGAAAVAARQPGADSIEGLFAVLSDVGQHGELLLGIALLASGLASTGVGCYAGQVVMEGFLRRSVPLVTRRLVSVVPAVALLVAGVDTTTALVMSQVVLSFGIPFALGPLLVFTSSRKVMGDLVNRRITTVAAAVASVLIVAMNVYVLSGLVTG
jgi:manganese transport protein